MQYSKKIFVILIISLFIWPLGKQPFMSQQKDKTTTSPVTNLAQQNNPSLLEEPKETVKIEQSSTIAPDSFSPLAARTGPQRFAVICSQFNDQPTTRWNRSKIESVMGTLNDFWYNVSDGAITIDYTVCGWYQSQYNISNIGDTYDGYDLLKEAIQLGDDAIDYSQIDYVLVWVNDPNVWAGWSSVGSWYQIDTNEGKFTVGFSIVGDNPPETEAQVWGRAAHEMGHAFGLDHTHANYNSPFSLMALGYPSDLYIYSQVLDKVTGWFDTSSNQQVIPQGTAGNFTLRPRYLNVPLDTHSLKVKISNTLYYMVEVISQKEEDKWTVNEGVLIYLVNKSRPDNRECVEMDANPAINNWARRLFDVGQTFTDNQHSITINVTGTTPPDGYTIEVINNAAGAPDLTIAEWGTPAGSPPPYESADIWVDSQVNGWGHYRHRYGPVPKGIGDEPWANHNNRLYARIHNQGLANAMGVTVKFYENIPIGAGAEGTWSLIGQKTIDINQGKSKEIYLDWTPTISLPPGNSGLTETHACIKVAIEPATNEVATSNNEAQENIDYFEVVKGSNQANRLKQTNQFQPIFSEFQVGNPYDEAKEIYINVANVSEGWDIIGQDLAEFHQLNPNEQQLFTFELIPDQTVQFGEKVEASLIVGYTRKDDATITTQEEYECYEYHLVPYSGFSFEAKTYYRGELDINAFVSDQLIEVEGTLFPIDDPPVLFPEDEDRFLLLEIIDLTTDQVVYELVEMEPSGYYYHAYEAPNQGNYSITAYYAGSEIITSLASVTLIVDTSSQIVTTSSVSSSVPISLHCWLILGAIITIYSSLRMKKRRRKRKK